MAKIANMIDSITGADEEAQKQKEQFSFLQKMALAKCEEFKSDLEKTALGDKSKIEIGGGRFFKYYSGQHVDIHSQANERIQETINSFFRGSDEDIKNGFQSLISGALETLINTSSIGEDQEDMFFIYPENNAVVRLDVKAYKYTFTKKGIIADCENIFCYTMAKSIIDHTTLKLDELLYFVSDMSGSEGNLEVVENFVDKITSVWKKLQSCDTNTVLHNYQIDCLKSELPQKLMKSKRFLNSANIDNINNLVQHAIPLGWQLTSDSFGRNRLTKIENNGIYETIIENYQESINRAIELVELVTLKDKYSN